MLSRIIEKIESGEKDNLLFEISLLKKNEIIKLFAYTKTDKVIDFCKKNGIPFLDLSNILKDKNLTIKDLLLKSNEAMISFFMCNHDPINISDDYLIDGEIYINKNGDVVRLKKSNFHDLKYESIEYIYPHQGFIKINRFGKSTFYKINVYKIFKEKYKDILNVNSKDFYKPFGFDKRFNKANEKCPFNDKNKYDFEGLTNSELVIKFNVLGKDYLIHLVKHLNVINLAKFLCFMNLKTLDKIAKKCGVTRQYVSYLISKRNLSFKDDIKKHFN